ncbi:cysteine hydrolase [Streptomyces sp. RFCAC02]|uniref:cysteine hydrolase family protein n=1 Tax=Streptomyces sp. RFCAC02 TaxID=2499143 RepID=UPI001022431D|nr:cysteine hydrolase [Streptomyces sp. RFCAC02]
MTDPTGVPALTPRTTALLAMDFQEAIIGRLPGADALVDRVAAAIAGVRAAGGTVGHVRVGFDDADYAAVPDTNKAFSAVAAARGMDADAPATRIDARVAPREGDIEVRKVRFGAFSTTGLADRLRERGITDLVLAGVSTSGVVLSTLTDAADRDYRLYVLADGVADPDPEVHDILLNRVFPRRAHVIDTQWLRDLLRTA